MEVEERITKEGITITDYQKTVYDDLSAAEGSGGWNQTTYPATIRYRSKKPKNWGGKLILLEVGQGNIPKTKLGLAVSPRLHECMINVYISYKTVSKDTETLQQYLQTLQGIFEAWIEAKAYTDCEIFNTIFNLDTNEGEIDNWIVFKEIT